MNDKAVATTPQYSTEQLAGIQSFDDAVALLKDAGVKPSVISDYGDGFSVLDDKRKLVNVPFVLLDYKFSEGDYNKGPDGVGAEFAICRVVTQSGEKFLFTDGSTGICEQVKDLRRRGIPGGVLCEKGISVSEYDWYNEKGEKTPAKTFYLAM